MKTILITGGTGLIGRHLTEALLKKGYRVQHLSRKANKDSKVKTYAWDIDANQIDKNCLEGTDTIIHLAGEGIADKAWTPQRKKQIIESRTKSIGLLYDLMKTQDYQIKSIISASGIGYYSDRKNTLLTETDQPADDFLSHSCIAWENAVDKGKNLGLRIIKFRTGIVLSAKGGALPKIANPIKWGIGAPLGNGQQWMSWIHIQDVINMYIYAIENEQLSGTYNMVAPHPVINKEFTQTIAKVLKKPLWMPAVPAFSIKLLFGELSILVLGSTKVSSEKIEKSGFIFNFSILENALKDIIKDK